MRRLLKLLVLSPAAASIATSPARPDGVVEGPAAWTGFASAELDSPHVLTGQRYRGTLVLRGETPASSGGELVLNYTQTPFEAASPDVLIEFFDADGELITTRQTQNPTDPVRVTFDAERIPAATPFEITYVVEFELLSGSAAASMLFEAEARSNGVSDTVAELPIEAELIGEFVEVEITDTGDDADGGEDTGDTADADSGEADGGEDTGEAP